MTIYCTGLSGELLSTDGIITYAVDDTKPDGSHPAIMGYVHCTVLLDP